jgi:hypothetical protein
MGADLSRRIFPNWTVATLFLMAAALLSVIVFASSLGVGSLLLRLLNSP